MKLAEPIRALIVLALQGDPTTSLMYGLGFVAIGGLVAWIALEAVRRG